ncbi:DUF2992 family protein [Anaerosphaera multitolerans]|uniref:DUF2992 family protein n=1 Tax=Anaerosphaera multitolerans TaxID=2487351 RepID=A0A437S8Q2_9FIRM|nr:DUF2992 family protein [Anaerosphaera multitolerans]
MINPKRKQREISKQMKEIGIGTKAQQALQIQYEANKIERKIKSRQKNEFEKQRRFEIKQAKITQQNSYNPSLF